MFYQKDIVNNANFCNDPTRIRTDNLNYQDNSSRDQSNYSSSSAELSYYLPIETNPFPRIRRQHNLVSIGKQGSRSRSPLVVSDEKFHTRANLLDTSSCSTMDIDKNHLYYSSQKIPTEPRNRNNLVPEAQTSFINYNQNATTDRDEDDLSLEDILAEIQSGSLDKLMSQSRGILLDSESNCNTTLHQNSAYMNSSTTFLSSPSPPASFGGVGELDDDQDDRQDHDDDVEGVEKNSLSCSDNKFVNFQTSPSKEHEMMTGFEIVWLNFTYTVRPNIFENPRWGKINKLFHREKRIILKGLSGGVKSGQMVALMGPSGAGKTCLLECISGIRRTGIGGKILLRGRKKAQLVIVPQYDNFMPQFSVEEIIIYGSKIKNPPKTDHKAIADEMIKQFGLEVCRKTNIQRCSGGQRKRVAIAQELVSKPNILILDEPTSGLDSSCCYQTMKVLRDVLDKSIRSEEPMVIITTIHQPSAKVFQMFDSIYLLSKIGYAAYSGPPNQLLMTIKDLTSLQCPKYSNPSDYMIELVSYDYGEEPVEELIEFEKKKARQFVKDFELRANIKIEDSFNDDDELFSLTKRKSLQNRFSSSEIKFKISNSDSKLEDKIRLQETILSNTNKLLAINTTNSPWIEYNQNVSIALRKATSGRHLRHPFFWHIYVHIERSFFQAIRDPILNNMRILIHIIFAYLLVVLYGRKSGEARGCPPVLGLPTEITDPDNENMIDLADNVGYLFMCIMMITYVSLMTTVLTFPIDIKTVGKEYKNGWYGTLTYFLGKTIADLPFIIIYPIIYCSIVWNLTNQASDQSWRFGSFTVLIIMNAMNSQSFGLILGALFVNSVTAATFLGPVMTIPWYLFTGFTKRIHRLDDIFKFASKFLFTRFVFEGLLDTAYGHGRCNCSLFLEKYYELRYEEAVRLGQLISVETLSSLDYYDDAIDSVSSTTTLTNNSEIPQVGSRWFEKTVDAATTVFADNEDLDLTSLMNSNVKASSLFSFGLDFEPTCPSDYRNYIIQDFRLENNASERAFYMTFVMLIAIRVLTFIVVSWKIRTRQM